MEKIKVTIFFALFFLFVFALGFLQKERFGSITGLSSEEGNDRIAEAGQAGVFYQIFYFVFLGVLLAFSVRFIFKHQEHVKKLRERHDRDFNRRLIKLDLSED